MIKLKYGNTDTFFIPANNGGLLVDTDYAGTLGAFYKAIKQNGLEMHDIRYVMATHYHPDHMGLIGNLTVNGVKLLLTDVQHEYVNFSDEIFKKELLPFEPIVAELSTLITCKDSRLFLKSLGIGGEIIHTPSHSADSISLILDDGDCFVGDLEPLSYLGSYEDNSKLRSDWDKILSFKPKRVFYSHRPEYIVC